MQETPPYSTAEIRILLSQYLDGALAPERMVELDALVEQFDHYKEELLKLQAARGLIQNSLEKSLEEPELRYNKVSDLVWKNIAGQLEVDQQAATEAYDAEFISAYYDGELAAEDPALQAFESQLYQNVDANCLLAELGQISETIRNFGYRQEENCTIDLTANVMAAFSAELVSTEVAGPVVANAADNLPDILNEETPLNSELEVISAYSDQALTPRETIEANRLIESQEQARIALNGFNKLSEGIQSVSQQMQTQAPDLWPQLEPVLQQSPEQGGVVVPIDRQKRLKNIARFAVPAAAAVFLVFFSLSGLRSTPNHQAGSSANAKAHNELASVPVGSLGRPQMRFSSPQEQDAMDVSSVMDSTASAPQPLKPVLEPSPKIAARSAAAVGEESAVNPNERTPSSEEYLFNALNEQMSDEDIANILGK